MDLTARQLSSLQEMGITVWSLRGQDKVTSELVSETRETSTVIDSIISNEQLLNCQCIVLIDDAQHHEQAKQLLYAMLAAIDIQAANVVLLSSTQLPQLNNIVSTQKVLFILGAELLDEPLARGAIHQILSSQINTIVSLGLNELLSKPENKILAWQDLQLIKSTLNHR